MALVTFSASLATNLGLGTIRSDSVTSSRCSRTQPRMTSPLSSRRFGSSLTWYTASRSSRSRFASHALRCNSAFRSIAVEIRRWSSARSRFAPCTRSWMSMSSLMIDASARAIADTPLPSRLPMRNLVRSIYHVSFALYLLFSSLPAALLLANESGDESSSWRSNSLRMLARVSSSRPASSMPTISATASSSS